jgi:acetyl-CoA C-acetyltransferase
MLYCDGKESMSNAPYLLLKAKNGYKLGYEKLTDSMINDGLWDVYNNIHMNNYAESCAKVFSFKREELDVYSINQFKKAQQAQYNNVFKEEIVKVLIKDKTNDIFFELDEGSYKVVYEKISLPKSIFDKNGVVTAANSSSINDGDAALLIMSEKKATELRLVLLVKIRAQALAAKTPIQFTTIPADAINRVLAKAGLTKDNIDLYEINKAFAVVSLAVNKLLNLDNYKVKVNGGTISLGLLIGASGARILVTLIHEIKRRNSVFGLASLCIGGREASAVIIKNYAK